MGNSRREFQLKSKYIQVQRHRLPGNHALSGSFCVPDRYKIRHFDDICRLLQTLSVIKIRNKEVYVLPDRWVDSNAKFAFYSRSNAFIHTLRSNAISAFKGKGPRLQAGNKGFNHSA